MMQLVLLLLSLMVVINRPVSSALILDDFQHQALLQHNYLRHLHCVGSITLNSSINTIAQKYASHSAANNTFAHSGATGLGENLWRMSSSAIINTLNGSAPTNSWYSEISSYNYSSPGYSSSTDHFTQVIWKGSTQLGIGIAFTNDEKTAYVVANYYPEGNVLGSFPANVLPLCSTATKSSSGTTTTSRMTTTSIIPRTTTTTTTPRRTTTSTTSRMTTTSITPRTTTTLTTSTTTKKMNGRTTIES